jgi:beta-phosphoglucomutase-like phosphatase (HAD superfamily)
MLSPDIEAVLCDADGNLFPSEEPAFDASAGVTNAFLASLGIETSFTGEELRLATTGKSFRTTAVDLAAAHGAAVEPAVLERWVQEERDRVTAHLGGVLRPDPQVLEPLRHLGERYVLAAVSSSAGARLAVCLAATGLDELLPEALVFSAEDSLPVPTSKPDPAIYRHACERLGLRPDQALAVEDSPVGAAAAVGAGIPTVGNLQFVQVAERAERTQQLFAAGVAAVVTSWAEVAELLDPSGLPVA